MEALRAVSIAFVNMATPVITMTDKQTAWNETERELTEKRAHSSESEILFVSCALGRFPSLYSTQIEYIISKKVCSILSHPVFSSVRGLVWTCAVPSSVCDPGWFWVRLLPRSTSHPLLRVKKCITRVAALLNKRRVEKESLLPSIQQQQQQIQIHQWPGHQHRKAWFSVEDEQKKELQPGLILAHTMQECASLREC